MLATHTRSDSQSANIATTKAFESQSPQSDISFLLSPNTGYDVYILDSTDSRESQPLHIASVLTRKAVKDTSNDYYLDDVEKIKDTGAVDVFLEDNYQLGLPYTILKVDETPIIAIYHNEVLIGSHTVASLNTVFVYEMKVFRKTDEDLFMLYIFLPAIPLFESGTLLGNSGHLRKFIEINFR